MIKRTIAIVTITLFLTVSFPINLLAANYGEGSFGTGNFNEGEITGSTSVVTSLAGSPKCEITSPNGTQIWLYQANANDTKSITIRFMNQQLPVDHFALEYGTATGKYQFGADNIGGQDIRSFTIGSLAPNTTYFFRIRAGNGCATGSWSNEISATTFKNTYSKTLKVINSTLQLAPTTVENSSQSSYSLKVKVQDSNGNPVENASVTLHSTPQTNHTNKEGLATFTNVEAGDHSLEIEYQNYRGQQNLNLAGEIKELNLNITIESKNVFLSPKVIGVICLLMIIIATLTIKLLKRRKTAF
jgi:hypothetical protein